MNTPIAVRPAVYQRDTAAKTNLWLARQVFKRKPADRAEFYNTIAYYLENFKLEETLEALAKRRIEKKEMYGYMLMEWLQALRDGHALTDVLRGWLPEDELAIIAVNARERKDRQGFEYACMLAESKGKMISSVVSNLAQPVVAIILLFIVMAMFAIRIIPNIVKGQDVSKWPWAGKAVVALSDFVVNQVWWLGLVLIGVIVLIGYSMPRLRPDKPYIGALRPVLDRIPPYSIYKSLQSASFLLSLSSLLMAGSELRLAIKQLRESASPYLQFYLELMDVELRRGNYTIIADSGLLDGKIADVIADFMQLSSSFDEAVKRVGEKSVEFTLERVGRLTAVLNALAGLLFVGMLAFFMYGIGMALIAAYT